MTSPLIGKMPYTSNEWRECIIWAQHERGVVEVQADVIGVCGVHLVGARWYVTHIPTGRIAALYYTEGRARNIAGQLACIEGMNSTHLGRLGRW